MLQALAPLTIVNFTVNPSVDALAICLSHLEVAKIRVAIRVTLKTLSMPQIPLPGAFVLPTVCVFHNTFSIPLAFHKDPQINRLRESPLDEVAFRLQTTQVNLIRL